jgi:hypothetical protein
MRSFYNEYEVPFGEDYTELSREFRDFAKKMMRRFTKRGYRNREIELVMLEEIYSLSTEERLLSTIKKRRKERNEQTNLKRD